MRFITNNEAKDCFNTIRQNPNARIIEISGTGKGTLYTEDNQIPLVNSLICTRHGVVIVREGQETLTDCDTQVHYVIAWDKTQILISSDGKHRYFSCDNNEKIDNESFLLFYETTYGCEILFFDSNIVSTEFYWSSCPNEAKFGMMLVSLALSSYLYSEKAEKLTRQITFTRHRDRLLDAASLWREYHEE